MVPSYEIFSGQFGYTEVLWIESVEGLGSAYDRMKDLAAARPGAYFVFCNRTHKKMAAIDTTIASDQKKSGLQ
jgi:hypothetical protein